MSEILRLSDNEVSLAFALSYVMQDLDLERLSRLYDAVTDWVDRRDQARAARAERFGLQDGDKK